jgi:hypothetical protein
VTRFNLTIVDDREDSVNPLGDSVHEGLRKFYRYSLDKKPGGVRGQGVEGTSFAVLDRPRAVDAGGDSLKTVSWRPPAQTPQLPA